jgi:Ni2+-binding GTPase involved in maturation of urease and hydrogenase
VHAQAKSQALELQLACAMQAGRHQPSMPLVMLCGQPSSGKSTLAAQLAQLCRQADHEPVVIDESILLMDKSRAYAGALACGGMSKGCAAVVMQYAFELPPSGRSV